MQSNHVNSINTALKDLGNTKSISSALSVCNSLLEYMGAETQGVEDIELSKLKLPNAERYDRWFEAHPHFRGDRACFELTKAETSLEAKFYALQKRSRLFIAGSVTFTPNFEDREYTRADPSMRVGIDFFLPPEKDSIIIVLSNKGSLRLVELSGRLTNTQHEIFALWHNVAHTSDKNILHTTIWESFKLSSLNKKFYEGIANSFTSLTQHLQTSGVEEQLANQFANRLHGRLLFLWFLRKKHIINDSKEYFTIGDQDDTKYYASTLSSLFFNILNNEDHKDADPATPYLNGGLFDQDADGTYWNTHKPSFPTGFFKTLYEHFDSFNFTTDESTPEYEQIAIDPEMLGRIFESFLATLKTETGAQAKKANGAFYTPREIVGYMSRESLRQYLYTALDATLTLQTSIDDLLDIPDNEWALAGTNSKRDTIAKEDQERVLSALQDIRVLDPAVGSGAFPMGILHKILSLYERLDPKFDPYETKISILRNNVYGVDIDPTAIEIARLRAWLSVIVDAEDVKKIKPLPNLDFKFVCANTLIGLTKSAASFTTDETLKPTLMRIRDEYYATSSKTKKDKLQKEYMKLTHKESLFDTEETKQLKSYQPFEVGSSTSFYDPELMHGVETFDVVIGNPPYGAKIDPVTLKKIKPFYPNSIKGKVESYRIFIERAIQLSREKGVVCYIVPNTWMYIEQAVSLRKFMLGNTKINTLVSLPQSTFNATVDSMVFVLKREVPNVNHEVETYEVPLKDALGSINEYLKNPNKFLQKKWLTSDKSRITLGQDLFAREIIQIVQNKFKPFKDYVYFKQGLIPYLTKEEGLQNKYISELKEDNSWSEYFDGSRCVDRYHTKGKVSYIKYGDWLYAPRDKKIFTQPRVIYQLLRNISLKRRIVATYLEQTIYSDRNTGLLFINPDINLDLKYILGILNSNLINYIYSKNFNSTYISFPSVGSLPMAIGSEVEQKKIVSLVDKILAAKKTDPKTDTKSLEDQIDTYVYKFYGLSSEEAAVIELSK